jgi:RsiW-degrading membrane proteinase PrsW (M82 family)
MGWVLLLAAVAPAAFMLHFVYVRDRYEREPLGRVLLVFFVGFLTVIPAAWFESVFAGAEKTGLASLAVSAWCVIALSEETMKYLVLRFLAVPHKSFNEVYDGILYGVAASLGFATVENIAYVFLAERQAMLIAIGRAVLSVPGHALWGVMMGYYVGLAKFEPHPARKRALIWAGLLTAVFWHGLYDFFAFGIDVAGEGLSILFGLGVLAVVVVNWKIGLSLIRAAQEKSVFKRPHPLQNPVLACAMHYKFCHQCGTRAPRGQGFCASCGQRYPG